MPRKKQKGPPARNQRSGGPAPKPQTPVASQSKPKGKGAGNPAPDGPEKKKAPLQANQRPIVPFLKGDRILLVGEGEFYLSFSAFLLPY